MSARSDTSDFLIVGGGVVGLTLALEARRRHPNASITLLEKETACGQHGSSRNSGVLHAGFYYSGDTLKARLSVEGNRRMTAYCLDRNLPIRQTGKLVVATTPAELETLDGLLERGRANGVDLTMLSADEARDLEPRARVLDRALFSPTTSSVDPEAVTEALVWDAERAGVRIRTSCSCLGRRGDSVLTPEGLISCGYFINAAGLYADRIAHQFGVGRRYVILPFKGVFARGRAGLDPLAAQIYPVPDLANPFLGVHVTVTAHGGLNIGPSAIPAFWREHYRGLANFHMQEMMEILAREILLFARDDFRFRSLALAEVRKYSRHHLVGLAARIVDGIRPDDYPTWGPAGIRAQLLDVEARRLVMDFCVEQTERSLHVLNAVSPAFTCCFAFAEFLFDRIDGGEPDDG